MTIKKTMKTATTWNLIDFEVCLKSEICHIHWMHTLVHHVCVRAIEIDGGRLSARARLFNCWFFHFIWHAVDGESERWRCVLSVCRCCCCFHFSHGKIDRARSNHWCERRKKRRRQRCRWWRWFCLHTHCSHSNQKLIEVTAIITITKSTGHWFFIWFNFPR